MSSARECSAKQYMAITSCISNFEDMFILHDSDDLVNPRTDIDSSFAYGDI